MNDRAANTFSPPSPEQVTSYLQKHAPTGPSRIGMMGPLMAIVIAWIISARLPQFGLLMMVIAFGGVLMWLQYKARAARQLEQRVENIRDMAMRRDWGSSLSTAWTTLPQLVHMPSLHGQTVMIMATDLANLRAFDSAIVVYDYLVERLPEHHAGATQLRVQRAIAQLSDDRLADADDAIRRLRGITDQLQEPVIKAGLQFAELLQQVRTHHYIDAIAASDTLIERLRPLGVDAGMGYGLMALAYLQLKRRSDEPQPYEEHARTWWRRATLLLPVPQLLERYPELQLVADSLPAASSFPPLPDASRPSKDAMEKSVPSDDIDRPADEQERHEP